MIFNQETKIREYLINNLLPFSLGGNYALIVVDPYYGGNKEIHVMRIRAFFDFVTSILNGPKIIWFYKSGGYKLVQLPEVTSIDFFNQGIWIHDRLLIIYDGNLHHYVGFFHLGGSINSFDINGNSTIPFMRISHLQIEEVREIETLLRQLETAFSRETYSTNWGC